MFGIIRRFVRGSLYNKVTNAVRAAHAGIVEAGLRGTERHEDGIVFVSEGAAAFFHDADKGERLLIYSDNKAYRIYITIPAEIFYHIQAEDSDALLIFHFFVGH